ncbi:hypothetical protein [Agromyces sp. Marseille-Q5079]|uniref:hypothetical protein n=1 Tax=Agromyces sp. Marseille-Q5079 TaxID=3439059 RepID=UPI003D9C87AB
MAIVSLNLRKLLAFYRERLAKKPLGTANVMVMDTYYSEQELRDMRARVPNRRPVDEDDSPPQRL